MAASSDFAGKSDVKLVQLSLDDSDNFLHLMQRYETRLMAYINRLLSVSQQDCEDILQEVFIKAYENLNGFDQDLKFSSWIYRITHNHAISYFRKFKNKPKVLSTEEEKMVFELASDLDIKGDIAKKLEGEKVREILDQLDQKYRDVLILKFLEDKDYTEISDILKKPMGTIATLINRAKAKFKKLILKYGEA